MVYSFYKFKHYLLEGLLKFFTNHSRLKYLVSNPLLEGRICKWLLFFQEFTIKVIAKLHCLNVGHDYLSRLESGEGGGFLDDQLPDADLF